jgi:ABC-type Fe3+ transport system substrate-binding protein
MALIRGAPHEEDAKRFYEFVTSGHSDLIGQKLLGDSGSFCLDQARLPE